MANYIDPEDGAPDCRMCGDTGSINGPPCDHRATRPEGVTAEIVGRFIPKNWVYQDNGPGMSLADYKAAR